ncbi:hypothetical protein [Lactococcus kimchii]|uniref:hypothetical protein n=1 Tax=Lactococcus sp. S-13 TaxID=2507158 RepID=UPI001023DB34|nr:hypothetical protein [Lactococcus sp. S-13]RZI48445.1 hypothetical protein EQJ87_02700 [Lactococcus sp. S-13]
MKLSKIETKYEENDYGFPLYDAEQMQEFMVENVRRALTLYGAKVCGFHLEQLEKEEIEKIIQESFAEEKND